MNRCMSYMPSSPSKDSSPLLGFRNLDQREGRTLRLGSYQGIQSYQTSTGFYQLMGLCLQAYYIQVFRRFSYFEIRSFSQCALEGWGYFISIELNLFFTMCSVRCIILAIFDHFLPFSTICSRRNTSSVSFQSPLSFEGSKQLNQCSRQCLESLKKSSSDSSNRRLATSFQGITELSYFWCCSTIPLSFQSYLGLHLRFVDIRYFKNRVASYLRNFGSLLGNSY